MKFSISIVTAAILSTSLHGQSAYDAIHLMDGEMGFGTRALAMGGAYAGLADDYTAIYWNPAGLGLVKEREIFTEFSHLNFTNEALFKERSTVDDQGYTRFRSAGAAFPFATSRGSLVLALGYNRIVNFDENLAFSGFSSETNDIGFDITDENDITGYYLFDRDVFRSEQMSTEGGLRQWTLGGAVALSPNFLMGITAAYTTGKEQYQLWFTQEDSDHLYEEFPGDFDSYEVSQVLRSDYASLSLKLGGLMHFGWGLRIGAAMTLPSTFSVDEVHSNSDELTFDDGYVDAAEESGRWDYRVKTPFRFDGGLSYRLVFLTFAASVRYRDWSQTRFLVSRRRLEDADYREFLEENELIRQTYRPTLEYRLGGEIALQKLHTKLRGGYSLIPSPVSDATGDEDRQFFSGGLSFALDRYVNLDLTLLHGSWERQSRDSFTPAGTVEEITFQKLLVGISFQF
ncbi:MAG: hypothetical protein V3U24_02775 [Candidatus Neomarinimicrobiota bacterium]